MPYMTDIAARTIELYRRHASSWAAARSTALTERAWIERFVAMLREGATVLDIGCGSGEPIARYIVDNGGQIIGVDSSPEMIALFRNNLPAAAAEVGDMRKLNLGRRFGGLIAWDSFFHLTPDDQRLMFPVFRKHAEPGAPLMFTSGPAACSVNVGTPIPLMCGQRFQ